MSLTSNYHCCGQHSRSEKIVEIGVSSDEKGSRVHVTSRPKVWHNIGAKSNAERNVQEIFKVLDENL